MFCRAAAGDDVESLVVHRGERAFVLLNKFPYASGHFMVAPYRHGAQFSDLDDAEAIETHRLAVQGLEALAAVYRPEGHNVGWNLGRIAGAGIVDSRPPPCRAPLERRHELHAGPRRRARPPGAPARDAQTPRRRLAGLSRRRGDEVVPAPSAHAPAAIIARRRSRADRELPYPGIPRFGVARLTPVDSRLSYQLHTDDTRNCHRPVAECVCGQSPHRRLRRAHPPRGGGPRRGARSPAGVRPRARPASTS